MTAGRGRDWSALNGTDPTPGVTSVIDDVARSYRTVSTDCSQACVELQSLGLSVGDGWSGLTMESFASAMEVLPPPALELSTAATSAAQGLSAWADAVTSYQGRADTLLDHALVTRDELNSAVLARPGYVAAVNRAQSALSQAYGVEDDDARQDAVSSASRSLSAAQQQLTAHDDLITRLRDRLAELRADAAVLEGDFTDHAQTVAGIVTSATVSPLGLQPLAMRLAAQAADAAGLVLDTDGDGRVSADELARLLLALAGDDGDGPQAQALVGLVGAIVLAATDADVAEDLIQSLGEDGLRDLLTALGQRAGATGAPPGLQDALDGAIMSTVLLLGQADVEGPAGGIAEQVLDFLLGDIGNLWNGGDADGLPLGQMGAAALRIYRMRQFFAPDRVLPVFNTGIVGRTLATLLSRVPALAGAGAWLASPAATQAFRGLGIAGGVYGTATGMYDLYQQGNPIDAFQADGAGYVADVASTAFSASSTAFFIAPNPVTGTLMVVTGAVWLGAEVVDHWDDITDWSGDRVDDVVGAASDAWDFTASGVTTTLATSAAVVDDLWEGGADLVSGVGGGLSTIGDGIGGALGSAGDLVSGWF